MSDYTPYETIARRATSRNDNFAYSPHGAATAEGIDQPIQYSSEYHDPELALTYYNYRHYNPQDGRWINRDPISEEGGLNLYRFIENHPLLWNDLLGLIPTVEELLKDIGSFDSDKGGIVDECWCEKCAKMLHRLVMDTAIKDYEALKDALGAGWKRTDLVNQMAGKLADLWRKHLCL